jgi:pimeloyl-ACP methyl ester carboxylesterase
MKSVNTPHRSIAYLEQGAGAPLVFLHAFPLSPVQWQDQIAHFSASWRCIAPAAPGLGSDAFSQPPSLAQVGDDLVALLEELEISEPIVLCGLSMGGYAAQWFAHRFPRRLRALVLCDTRAGADNEAARAKRDETIAFARSHEMPEIMVRLRPTLLGETTRQTRPEVVERVNEIAFAHDPARVADATAALRDRPDMTAWLENIDVPTLLLFGDEDGLIPREEIEALQRIRGARLEMLPQSGHLSNLETPAAFNAALESFLRTL